MRQRDDRLLMESGSHKKKVFTTLALTAVFNTVIALFLTHVGFGEGFPKNFVFSQSIGLCMCSAILAAHHLLRRFPLSVQLIGVLFTMFMGAAAGTLIGSRIFGIPLGSVLHGREAFFLQALFISILFGSIITYFFFSREKMSETRALLQKEQIRGLTMEKDALETRLRILQAQIEPHFLFNTLSNILSLLESDPTRGKAMLIDLTRYLRGSLSRTREKTTTLGQELEMIRAYLDIHKIRMGERLQYTMEAPAHLRDAVLPPMLIQPLVENAVEHGLGPMIEGGRLTIQVQQDYASIRLIVSDTGSGPAEDGPAGIGLANVRERLDKLYSGKGRLILEENRPCGLRVTMEIPYEGNQGDHRR